jgi:hypothetical protein
VLALCGALAAGCTGVVEGGAGPGTGGVPAPGGSGGVPAASGGGSGPVGTGGSAAPGSGGSAGQPGSGGPSGAGGTAIPCRADAPDPGEAPLRMLTRQQYLNTVRDLFGNVNVEGVFPPVVGESTFGFVQSDVDQVALENYQRGAETIAAWVAASKNNLDKVAPCAAGAEPKTCARTFVQTFGARLYRAPVVPAEVDAHLALYDVGAPNGGYAHGIELMLRGMLQASRFLYRVELGTTEAVGAKAVKLSGYELAARLSYSLWNTAPDDTLRAAAMNGTLATPAAVMTQAQRMLGDARGKAVVPRFLEAWIRLPELDTVAKDTSRYPEWTDALRASLVGQARGFIDDVVTAQGGKLTALLTSPTVLIDKNLAAFYGADAAPLTAGAFQKTTQTGRASGLLTLPAFLATQAKAGESSPIYRGKFVREQLLCQQLPAPPADVPPAPAITATTSTRGRLTQHEVDPACSGCHRLMDPIGFAFENYDAIGRYRTSDGGMTIDASGMVVGSVDLDGAFVGVGPLGTKLAGSAQVETCVATQWFRHAMARFEQSADSCSVQAVVDAFRGAGGDLRTLPPAIVQTGAFLYRRPIVPVP